MGTWEMGSAVDEHLGKYDHPLGNDRPIAYWLREPGPNDGGHVVIRASSLPGCDIAYVASMADMVKQPPPKKLQEAFDFGKEHEAETLARFLSDSAWTLGEVQCRAVIPMASWTIAGNVDGILHHGPHRAIAEVKTLARSNAPKGGLEALVDAWPLQGLWRKYGWQGSVYGHALGLDVVMIVGWKETGEDGVTRIVDVESVQVPREKLPVGRIEILKRGIAIRNAWDELRGGIEDGKVECAQVDEEWACGYGYLHKTRAEVKAEKQKAEDGEWDEVLDEPLVALLKQWKKLKEQTKVYEGAAKTIAERIDARFVEMGYAKGVEGSGWIGGKGLNVVTGADRGERIRVKFVERSVGETTRKAYVQRYLDVEIVDVEGDG